MREATRAGGRGAWARGPPLPAGTYVGSEITTTGDLVLGNKEDRR